VFIYISIYKTFTYANDKNVTVLGSIVHWPHNSISNVSPINIVPQYNVAPPPLIHLEDPLDDALHVLRNHAQSDTSSASVLASLNRLGGGAHLPPPMCFSNGRFPEHMVPQQLPPHRPPGFPTGVWGGHLIASQENVVVNESAHFLSTNDWAQLSVPDAKIDVEALRVKGLKCFCVSNSVHSLTVIERLFLLLVRVHRRV